MARKTLDRVVWEQGMLLSPQHMQQQDLYNADRVQARFEAMHAQPWGVSELQFDEAALKGGQVTIVSYRGILPDGAALLCERGEIPTRSVEGHFSATAERLEVFIGVPEEREGVANVAEDPEQRRRSMQARTRKVHDMVRPDNERELKIGRPACAILFDTDDRDGYRTTKVAEIVREATGTYTLERSYIPPCTDLRVSKLLSTRLEKLLATIVVKRRELTGQLSQRESGSVEFNTRDITRFLQLDALNGALPALRYYSEEPKVSPLAAYMLLVELAGRLCTFNPQVDSSTLPRFAFLDLRSSFEPLISLIEEMLGATAKVQYVDIPVRPREDGMWIGQFTAANQLGCNAYVLVVQVDEPEQEVANSLPKVSKISSWNQISEIVRAATPGAPLTSVHRPPPEIPVKPGEVYFTLDVANAYWKSLIQDKNIAIFIPRPYDVSRTKIWLRGIPG